MAVAAAVEAERVLVVQHQPTRRRELRCTGCGYGAFVTVEPPRCPMCGCTGWQERRADGVPLRLL